MKRCFPIAGVCAALILGSCFDGGRRDETALPGGIGGTGATAWEGGIGGTGVVGTITGFGSIVVNGLHIHYAANQPVETGRESMAGAMVGADFAVGQVVAAETQFANGRLEALRLILRAPLVGPVQAVNPERREIRVLGETVRILPGARFGRGTIDDLHVGQNVVVSGLRGADRIHASRIDPVGAIAVAAVSGTVTARNALQLTLDNRIRLEIAARPEVSVAPGDYVTASGVRMTANGGLRAQTLARHYGPLFDGRVARMAIEDVFTPNAATVAGIGPLRGVPSGRGVVFASRRADGRITIDGMSARTDNHWRDPLPHGSAAPDNAASAGSHGGGGNGNGGGSNGDNGDNGNGRGGQ